MDIPKEYTHATILKGVLNASFDHSATVCRSILNEEPQVALNHLKDIQALQNELQYRLEVLTHLCEMQVEDEE